MEDLISKNAILLLQELHILTRDGKLNHDSRRKLKQVHHLFNFIKPMLEDLNATGANFSLVDHGAGKSYLGFILYDLFFKEKSIGEIYGIEHRDELVKKSKELAMKCEFSRMHFLSVSVEDSITDKRLPETVDVVTALHACNSATDDAIKFGLTKKAKHFVLVPCCQAEVASVLRKHKTNSSPALAEIWRHPLHTREFGSHLTNVLRCLALEAQGYQVTVTELIGWEHSMKNELIIAKFNPDTNRKKAHAKLIELIEEMQLNEISHRFLF